MLYLTLIAQCLASCWFALTHWIPISPLNYLEREAFSGEHKTNLFLHGFQSCSRSGFYSSHYNAHVARSAFLVGMDDRASHFLVGALFFWLAPGIFKKHRL
jgi:hypothetical protein